MKGCCVEKDAEKVGAGEPVAQSKTAAAYAAPGWEGTEETHFQN